MEKGAVYLIWLFLYLVRMTPLHSLYVERRLAIAKFNNFPPYCARNFILLLVDVNVKCPEDVSNPVNSTIYGFSN